MSASLIAKLRHSQLGLCELVRVEATDWIIYLADANGARLSADVPFHTDPGDKQWYFVKFRRKF